MSDCLFCKIIAGEIPSTKVYEDELTYAFRDINPMMPTHVLVVPRQHLTGLSACLRTCTKVAAQEGLTGGFRVVSNCGDDACQSVKHLHFHVLGGGKMTDKMG